jgi:hypothetical protein
MHDPSFEAPFDIIKFVQAFVICSGSKPVSNIARIIAENLFI